MSTKCVFLGMGGTIAGQAQSTNDNVGYTAAQLRIDDLLRAVPGLDTVWPGDSLVAEQVAQLDSKDMTHGAWFSLAERICHYLRDPQTAGVVVTHGTDTLEETAFFLSLVLPVELQNSKPVVLTCAMRPATAAAPDGPQNLADAAVIVRTSGARGVVVVCAGVVHGGLAVQKTHPYRLNAFDSGEGGPLGLVEEGRVRMLQAWPMAPATPSFPLPDLPAPHLWPRVEMVWSHAGVGGGAVRALCACSDPHGPLGGIVVAATGNGSIHADLEKALHDAERTGVRVVRTTRCAYGSIVKPNDQVQEEFASADVAPVKARIALMLSLALEASRPVLQTRAR